MTAGDVYHWEKAGSPRSGCMTCCTPHESGLPSPYGGNCFPTVRRWGQTPSRVREITWSQALSSRGKSSGVTSPGTMTNPSSSKCFLQLGFDAARAMLRWCERESQRDQTSFELGRGQIDQLLLLHRQSRPLRGRLSNEPGVVPSRQQSWRP
jgi:hypothetical protein